MGFMSGHKDKFKGASEKTNVPDGEHLVRVRGMRRTEMKSGAGIINIDLEIVKTNENGLEVNTYAGREFDVRYFFPIDNDEMFDQTFERFMQRDMKHILGKVPEGDFTDDAVFEQWSKSALGRGAWVNRQTSTKVDKNGNPYVNIYFNKSADVPPRAGGANKPQPSNAGAQAAQNPSNNTQAAQTNNASNDGDDDDIPF